MKKIALLLLITLIPGLGFNIMAMDPVQTKKAGRPLEADEYAILIDDINGRISIEEFQTTLPEYEDFKEINYNQYILVRNEALNQNQYVNLMEYVLRLPADKRLIYAQLLIDNSTTDLNATLSVNGHPTTLMEAVLGRWSNLTENDKDSIKNWLKSNGVVVESKTPQQAPGAIPQQPETQFLLTFKMKALAAAIMTSAIALGFLKWFTSKESTPEKADIHPELVEELSNDNQVKF